MRRGICELAILANCRLAGAAGLACDPDLLRRDPGDRLAARRVRAVCAFGDNSPFRGFLKLLIQLRVAPGRIDGDETFGKSVLCAEQPPTDLRYLLHIERNDTGVTCGDRRMTTWRKEITTEMNDPWERATATFLSCRAPCGCSGLFWLGPYHPNARSLGEPRVCWRSIRRLDWLFDDTSLRLVCTPTSVRAIAANRPEDLPKQRRRDVLPMKLVMKVPTLCGFRSAATMECTTARRVPMLGFKACMRPACDCGVARDARKRQFHRLDWTAIGPRKRPETMLRIMLNRLDSTRLCDFDHERRLRRLQAL